MLSEEEKERRRRLANRSRKLSAMGKPQRVLPHEYEHGMQIIDRAHESGMSYTQIAYQLESQKSTISKLANRETKTMHRKTYEKLLRLQPELPERTGGTRRGGAKLDPTCTVRRLRALSAAGWTSRDMAPYIGMDQRNLSSLLLGKVGFVYAVTVKEIAAAYDKLQYMVADEHCTPRALKAARNKARKNGWAPTWAWDEDTIDDPAAEPEWTGACGSAEGYRIHIRETIFEGNYLPLCERCRAVVETRPANVAPKVIFNRENLIAALKASPKTTKAVAREVLGDGNNARDTLYRWRDGSRTPRTVGMVQRLADALDVPVSTLLDQEAMDEAAARPVVGHGEFNPYVLRAAMEMSGMSQHKMSLVPGSLASAGAIGKWVNGEMKPQTKDKVKPIAKYFGVDVEVFYQ